MAGAVDSGEPIADAGRPRSGGVDAGRPRSDSAGVRRNGGPAQDRGQRLAELARRQYGVVSIRQLQQLLGYSRAGVGVLVNSGRLHRVHHGVYAVGHANLSVRGEELAAVLAVGPGALLSYHSAGWLWGVWRSPKPIHVTAYVPRHHPAPPGVVRHRARNLVDDDRTMVDGIPVTSVARTLLDLAWKLRAHQLRRVLRQVEDLGLFDLDAINAVIDRNRGHHGARRLRYALSIYEPRTFTRSEFERRFVARLIATGLPRPATSWNEVGYEIDVYWPDHGFGVELDTFETHGTRDAFESDHDRDLAFALAGIETIRISERQFIREPGEIVNQVSTLLGRARST